MRISDWSSDVCSSDLDAIGIEALNAEIERSGLARRLDTRFDAAEIFVEDGVLERDAQREDAVEPALDRRKVFGKPAGLALQIESGQPLALVPADRLQLHLKSVVYGKSVSERVDLRGGRVIKKNN